MASSNMQQQLQWLSTVNAANLAPTKLWFNDRDTNYQAWKEQMLCLVESQGLLGFLDGTNAPPTETISADYADGITNAVVKNQDYDLWRRTDLLLKGWILCSLSDDLVCAVSPLRTSRDVWLELENKFRALFNSSPPTGGTNEPNRMAEIGQNARATDLIEYLPLRRAALKGDYEAARQIFDNDPGSKSARISLMNSTALHIAVGTGERGIDFVENLVAEPDMRDESIAILDDLGWTALSVAAAVGNIEAATILVRRMRRLLYIPNNCGNFPVQIAALYAQKDMLEYLIRDMRPDIDVNPYSGLTGLRLLIYVIDAGFFDIALDLVRRFPDLARLKLPDNTSALKRIAAKRSLSFGGMELPVETRQFLLRAYQRHFFFSFRSGNLLRSGTVKIVEDKILMKPQVLNLVKCLCNEIESLSFMEAKDIFFDALIAATELGHSEIVKEIVEAFPSAIYSSKPGSNQHIFHVAVENRSELVFNLIYQMSDHKHLYLDSPDCRGNNLLHSAGKLGPSHKLNEMTNAAIKMRHEMLWYKEVEKLVHPNFREQLNNAGKTPKMVFKEEHKILKEEGEKWMRNMASSCIIASSLIATITFSAAITVPGGTKSGNTSGNGFPIFSNPAFTFFAVTDVLSLLTSTISLLSFLTILTSHYIEEDFLYALPIKLACGLGALIYSIFFMMGAFSAASYLVFGREKAFVLVLVAIVSFLASTFFWLTQNSLIFDFFTLTWGFGIFVIQSSRPFS